MLAGLSVLDVLPSVAVIATAPEYGVEGLERLRVDAPDRQRAEQRSDVLVDLLDVALAGRHVDVENLGPAVEELGHGGSRAWVAPLVDLARNLVRAFSASRLAVGPGARVSVR
jgi:hypothetical protein